VGCIAVANVDVAAGAANNVGRDLLTGCRDRGALEKPERVAGVPRPVTSVVGGSPQNQGLIRKGLSRARESLLPDAKVSRLKLLQPGRGFWNF
jgi:hypothetical protein